MAIDLSYHTDAILSQDRKHRLALHRIWNLNDEDNYILFIGVNPSRGDERYNDPTLTRCINFASSWGYSGMYFGNLYSYRTPDIKELQANIKNAVHPLCDINLLNMANQCKTVVFCWGSWKFIDKRVEKISQILKHKNIKCFGFSNEGHPKHPLYLAKTSELIPWINQRKAQ